MPMLAAEGGAGSAAAGLITGALLGGTVIAEAAAAAAIRRCGYRAVLAAGALLLGAPTLALLPREPLAIMVAVSFVRGLGFGLCGVAAGALTALLLLAERRARAWACSASSPASPRSWRCRPASGWPATTRRRWRWRSPPSPG